MTIEEDKKICEEAIQGSRFPPIEGHILDENFFQAQGSFIITFSPEKMMKYIGVAIDSIEGVKSWKV